VNSVTTKQKPWYKYWPAHVPKTLQYPEVPAWWILEKNLQNLSTGDAIVFIDYENMNELERYTYEELWNKARCFASALLKMGITKGQRIATVLPNSPAQIICYYGTWLTGATIVPINAFYKATEIKHPLTDSKASMVICSETTLKEVLKATEGLQIKIVVASVREEATKLPINAIKFEELLKEQPLRQEIQINPSEDVAVILYTGGTTGEPKGAMLTHRNIVCNTMQFAHWYDFEPAQEKCVCVIPMSHSGGMSGVMNVPLYSGATLLVMQRANPPVVGKVVEKYRATRLFGVATLYAALLNDEEARKCDYSSLKACRTGAAPLPVQIKKAFDELVGHEVLIEAYGITETSPLAVANPINRAKAGSIGIPLPDTEAKVVDIETGREVPVGQEGELWIKGPQVMKGYLNREDATREAIVEGWFRSGDVAKMDEEGYFYIVDRLKDFINASGFKVWPREVEEVIYKFPGVKLCAVVGVPDPYRGENVKAFIVPTDEAKGKLTESDIVNHCRKYLTGYKVPRMVEFRDELPVTPTGKILRRVLREEERKKAQQNKNPFI